MKIKNYLKSNLSFHSQLNKTSILNTFLCIGFLFFSINSFGQKSIDDHSLNNNPYLHNLQIEKFFLHTNKTSYFPGEKIWFKAYVVNDTDDKPSLNTTNLHINLHNSQKELVSSNLYLVENGKTNGKIELSKELPAGKYYLELDTQWNQNFDNNNSITLINVISTDQKMEGNHSALQAKNITAISENKKNLNIEFFPESNTLLDNTENTIAFTSSNNLSPTSINGDIIDDKTGIIVAKLTSNSYGMGSFNLFLRPERSYTASVEYNGTKHQFAIPKSQPKGFLISESVNQSDSSSLSFTLKTNNATLKSHKNKTLLAVLHRNGMANIVVPIQLKKGILKYSFNLKKENLYNGINTITAFDKFNNPVSDHSFFYQNKKDIGLEISQAEVDKDSLTLNFDLKNQLSNTNLSVSILPQETKLYNGYSSIKSAFLLAPYFDDASVNLSEIATNENLIDFFIAARNKKNKFPYKEGRKIIPIENGLLISGNVSANVQDLSNYKVMLSSKENDILLIQPVGENNSFAFDNLVLKHPSKYKLALLDPQGKIVKTGFRMSNELIAYNANPVLAKNTHKIQQVSEPYLETEESDISLLPLTNDDVTLLDVVELSKKKKRENTLKELGISEGILENEFSRLYPIDEKESAISIVDYFQRLAGIKVINDCPLYLSLRGTRGTSSFMGVTTMSVFIDGNRIDDTVFLCSMKASEFIAVSSNSLGAGAGLQGEGGILNLYTRKGKFTNYSSVPNEDIVVSETDFGYSISEDKYTNQLYTYKNNDSKKFYGTIGWFPNINVIPNSTYKLKLDKNGYDNFKIIINGLSEDGNLLYKVIDINSEEL